MAIKQKEFDRTLLRIDPMLAKVHAFIPGTIDPTKAIVEKNVTNNFITMLLSWLIIKSANKTKPVIIYDGDKPDWEITIKRL